VFFFAVLVGIVATFSVLFSQALMSRAFGWTSLSAGLLVDLAIEPLPFGEHTLVHIDWTSSKEIIDGVTYITYFLGMTHSWVYSHPAAISCLQKWARLGLR
jgi:hypothetical protein